MTRILQRLLPRQRTSPAMSRPTPCPLCDRPIGVDAPVRLVHRRDDWSTLLAHRDCAAALARHRGGRTVLTRRGRRVANAALTVTVAVVLIGGPLLVAWIDGFL